MTEDNQNPANPAPPSAGDDSATPPPAAEENPIENKVVDEPTPEPTAAEIENDSNPSEVTPEAAETNSEPVEAEPASPESETEESSAESKLADEPAVEKAEVTEDPQPVAETPVEKIVNPEVAPAETPIQPTAETEEEVELIQGDVPRQGDKIEVETEMEAKLESTEDPSATPTPPLPSNEGKSKTGFKEDGVTPLDAEEKLFSAIGYISFLALLPFLTRKDSEFAQHHGRQGLVIFIMIFIFTLLFSFSGTMRTLAAILTLAVAIGGGLLAYKGDWFKVPVIYDLSLKLKTQTPLPPTPGNNG